MGPSFWQIVIVLVIVILLFGTKRLRNVGSDLGSALKGFKSAVKEDDDADFSKEQKNVEQKSSTTQDSTVSEEQKDKS